MAEGDIGYAPNLSNELIIKLDTLQVEILVMYLFLFNLKIDIYIERD